MSAEARLAELNLELPPAAKAMGLYRPALIVENLVYLSGHGPLRTDGSLVRGRLGEDLNVEEGFQAARLTGLAMLATLHDQLGSLDRIARLVKTLGLVCATADFVDHPAVINGFSELMRNVFGESSGIAARSAFGAVSLPAGMAVEIEAVFQLRSDD